MHAMVFDGPRRPLQLPLGQANEALARLRAGQVEGAVVLRPGPVDAS